MSSSNTTISTIQSPSGEKQDNTETVDSDEMTKVEITFPIAELNKLEEMINKTRWVVPVLPGGELLVLLESSIKIGQQSDIFECTDEAHQYCQRFIKDGLVSSFTKILCDDARSIVKNIEKLVELCVVTFHQDILPLLDLLAVAMNPSSSGSRAEWTQSNCANHCVLDQAIRKLCRFLNGNYPSELHDAYCGEDHITKLLDKLSDDELKKESKSESKSDAISSIIRALKNLSVRVPGKEEVIRTVELFRLKIVLRLLQMSSFNGKMSALNEMNRLIMNVSYITHRNTGSSYPDDDWLTADRIAEWIQQNDVLNVVLRDNLHQPQYVEKLEKILRFAIKEKAVTFRDLDLIWAAQAGKHEAIVKNVHDLLAKLAWDFSAQQLDYLFDCFQKSWTNASNKQREKLIELIRRLAEDDKEGFMAQKVLELLWNLVHDRDVPIEIMDLALSAHIKILDYNCSPDRDVQKTNWIDKCVEELKESNWVIPAVKHIQEICQLFYEAPRDYSRSQPLSHLFYRHEVINQLQQKHKIVSVTAENLSIYMNKARAHFQAFRENSTSDVMPASHYSHSQQVDERLTFLRYCLRDGHLILQLPEAELIWFCLAEKGIHLSDREACFTWFSRILEDTTVMQPETCQKFFEKNILTFDPSLLTENGVRCFELFFRAVNGGTKINNETKPIYKHDQELIGVDYIWRVVLCSEEDVANKAIELLKETYITLNPDVQNSQVLADSEFIETCMKRLQVSCNNLRSFAMTESSSTESQDMIVREATRNVRVLKVIKDYFADCDDEFSGDRTILPHGRLRSCGNNRTDLYVNNEILNPADDNKLVCDMPIRDRSIIYAKVNQGINSVPSSPDSSSESSSGYPNGHYDGPNIDAEKCLPGVVFAGMENHVKFLFDLADVGAIFEATDGIVNGVYDLLQRLPSANFITKNVETVCKGIVEQYDEVHDGGMLKNQLGETVSLRSLYSLEVIYAMLMPAFLPQSESTENFQKSFIKSGGLSYIFSFLRQNISEQSCNRMIQRQLCHLCLKIGKFLLTVTGHAQVAIVADAVRENGNSSVTPAAHSAALVLQQALQTVPCPQSEFMLINIAAKMGKIMKEKATRYMPSIEDIRLFIKIAWTSAGGLLSCINISIDELQKAFRHGKTSTVTSCIDEGPVAMEALEVLGVSLALCPSILDTLSREKSWQLFIVDVLSVRICAAEQFLTIATKCSPGNRCLLHFLELFFSILTTAVEEFALFSGEYFLLSCRLLNYGHVTKVPVSKAENLLLNEISWLRNIKEKFKKNNVLGDIDQILLDGHLSVTKELLSFISGQKKSYIGCKYDNISFIEELMYQFLFPASKLLHDIGSKKDDINWKQVKRICHTPITTNAAMDLLVAFCVGSISNFHLVCNILSELFNYPEISNALDVWEYSPTVGCRPSNGYVGLKNGGATCYMNSVLQQVCKSVLNVQTSFEKEEVDAYDGSDKGGDIELNIDPYIREDRQRFQDSRKDMPIKEYNLCLLKQVQSIFAHLTESLLQYYIPRGFWKMFRLQGNPVNLREQQDAYEFFNSLVDTLDEALKDQGFPPFLSHVFGGTFADQKICKGCPHRYSRDESFTAISVDIRNHQNMVESLEQYVKGDLLEGVNAYYCERCDKKVDTVKRMCIKKLPKILAIQLKRFDYDWERDCAVKFNDYFEFPREFDMEPFTVAGLAKIEDESIEDIETDSEDSPVTQYRLVGMIVHSGQANGGHYYSYIIKRGEDGNGGQWFKFDDGDVTECRMDDDEELKSQCFGGEYMGEVYDQVVKRMSFRRQKRWWNSYILFYERKDIVDNDGNMHGFQQAVNIPKQIHGAVIRQNIYFLHEQMHYSYEYFQFIRKLIIANFQHLSRDNQPPDLEEFGVLSIEMASKFLFSIGFRTKKGIRGSYNDWYDAIALIFRHSRNARIWFARNVLFAHPQRFTEYLLECPVGEMRYTFAKIIVTLCHLTLIETPTSPLRLSSADNDDEETEYTHSISDNILKAVLSLINRDLPEHGRYYQQYFQLFLMYANFGMGQRIQLLRLGVADVFMNLSSDENTGSVLRYQSQDLSKLHAVTSILIRSCDISNKEKQCETMPGNYGENPYTELSPHDHKKWILPLPREVEMLLFIRKIYLKKILEEYPGNEETAKLIEFCSWENEHFSRLIVSKLLYYIQHAPSGDRLKPYIDLFVSVLTIEDSWQQQRIHLAMQGISDERLGIFDIIINSRGRHQKRSYLCMKFLVSFIPSYRVALELFQDNHVWKQKWTEAVNWLGDELDRNTYPTGSGYGYTNWSPPAQSNETSAGSLLERSNSARVVYAKALELVDEGEYDDIEEIDELNAQNERNKRYHAAPNRYFPESDDNLAASESTRHENSDEENRGSRRNLGN
ncbi:uncharacterized protein TRIADDRAFT_59589 [Trichoplax adhaerens]|uniref:ubiquitinyl hydrolase 1 n=1 Tax=Trichoplax adhaerens TaxID=10228 RepID=B3S5E7_TRIAD|nr:hypothetical protein TRIADDRAFT_59589 [Trichoplax adhaerens]EDV22025.1 hypothetical protein TRIADDRAFT_59589 [Trichoplax adhaerens]|eukprot:XP_002115662.1 hypothetical protein TRIADDRAFT_59589 [Trichoplax adhaerens]